MTLQVQYLWSCNKCGHAERGDVTPPIGWVTVNRPPATARTPQQEQHWCRGCTALAGLSNDVVTVHLPALEQVTGM